MEPFFKRPRDQGFIEAVEALDLSAKPNIERRETYARQIGYESLTVRMQGVDASGNQ